MSTAEDQLALAWDSGRTAIALVRLMRRGDYTTALQLQATLTEEERGNLVGALLAFLNQALNTCESISEYARAHGCPELTNTADDVLTVMALGFAEGDGQIHD